MIWRGLLLLWIAAWLVAAFLWAPLVPDLGATTRVLYFHIPSAWVTALALAWSMVHSVLYLVRRRLEHDDHAAGAAELGLVFCIGATVSGSLWAHARWGSYWNWDPRETSIFVLLLIYGAYFSLRSAVETEEKRATLSSAYSIIAAVTVPFFIFIMPRIMTGLHPGAKGDPEGAGPVVEFKMSPNMRIIFFSSLIAFTLLFYWMFTLKVRTAQIEAHNHQRG